MSEECRSFIQGSQLCRDGFPISSACRGAKCHACGVWIAEKSPPACMRDDFTPVHLINDAGYPRFPSLPKENTKCSGKDA